MVVVAAFMVIVVVVVITATVVVVVAVSVGVVMIDAVVIVVVRAVVVIVRLDLQLGPNGSVFEFCLEFDLLVAGSELDLDFMVIVHLDLVLPGCVHPAQDQEPVFDGKPNGAGCARFISAGACRYGRLCCWGRGCWGLGSGNRRGSACGRRARSSRCGGRWAGRSGGTVAGIARVGEIPDLLQVADAITV